MIIEVNCIKIKLIRMCKIVSVRTEVNINHGEELYSCELVKDESRGTNSIVIALKQSILTIIYKTSVINSTCHFKDSVEKVSRDCITLNGCKIKRVRELFLLKN